MSRRLLRPEDRLGAQRLLPRHGPAPMTIGLLHLQRTAGNRATTSLLASSGCAPLAVQRHAAASLLNTFSGGGLGTVTFTPANRSSVTGSLTFRSGRTNGLSEIGAGGVGRPHRPPGLRNLLLSGGLSQVIFTPDDGGAQMTGDLSFRSGRLNELHELDVQRHSAPGLTNAFGAGGLSDVIFTSDAGVAVAGDISFGAGRVGSLVEHGGPKPKPRPPKDNLLSYSRRSKGERVRELQRLLNLNGGSVIVDGDFGRATDVAVREFQRTQGLRPDGVVGPATLSALSWDRRRHRELDTG